MFLGISKPIEDNGAYMARVALLLLSTWVFDFAFRLSERSTGKRVSHFNFNSQSNFSSVLILICSVTKSPGQVETEEGYSHFQTGSRKSVYNSVFHPHTVYFLECFTFHKLPCPALP